ncbi:class I SAM-dependent methyltransferase [Mycolicibacterium sp. XJ870]
MMAEVVNVHQDEVWNGVDGVHWADHFERYDAMAQGFDRELLVGAALTEASDVLDIGCGTGQTTRLAARQSRRGRVVGVDLSAPMLECARRLATEEGITNLSFVRADAQVHSFPRDHFDVAISRAGVMFFADPVAAFVNILDTIRPGGRVAFVTHRDASKPFQAIYEAVAEHVAVADELSGDGVELFAEPQQVGSILYGAGFVEIVAKPVDVVSFIGRGAEEATDFLFDGPLHPMLRHANAAGRHRARAAVLKTLRGSESDDGVRLPAHGWLYTATKPGRRRGP